jgi:uncharacterized protein YndB with AHSA1/START domain
VTTDLHEISPGLRIGAVGVQEIRVERQFSASPEAVFALYTTPRLIERWWPPEGTTAVIEGLELVPGGSWSMTVDEGGVSSLLFGAYPDVNPPWGYVQSFESEEAGHLWVEAVSLRPHGGNGTLAANVGIMASAEARDQALDPGGFEGLRRGYDRMKATLESART